MATTGVVSDTIFHIHQSNIAAFMHITLTAGWVTRSQLQLFWELICLGKTQLISSSNAFHDPVVTVSLSHRLSNAQQSLHSPDQDHLSYAYAGQATITPNILIAAATELELRLYIDTGCSILIVKDVQLLTNVCNVTPIHASVQGVASRCDISEAGDLHFLAADNVGIYCTIVTCQ
eukprot:430701-Rhodomonas_salina.1